MDVQPHYERKANSKGTKAGKGTGMDDSNTKAGKGNGMDDSNTKGTDTKAGNSNAQGSKCARSDSDSSLVAIVRIVSKQCLDLCVTA